MLVRYGSAVYRLAGIRDLAQLVAGFLFRWLADAHLSKTEVLDWLRKLYQQVTGKRAAAIKGDLLPQYLVKHIAKVFSELSEKGVTFGDFVAELSSALDKPPAGFVWVVRNGQEYLVRNKPGKPTMPIRGNRFKGYVLIGIWWTTMDAKSRGNRQIMQYLKKHQGGVFFKRTDRETKMREYGGFALAMSPSVEAIGIELRSLAEEASQSYHLSAIRLDRLAEQDPATGRTLPLNTTDQFFTHSIKSIIFRPIEPRYTLDQLVNGMVPEYQDLLGMLRHAI
jgi:hypothetical protein